MQTRRLKTTFVSSAALNRHFCRRLLQMPIDDQRVDEKLARVKHQDREDRELHRIKRDVRCDEEPDWQRLLTSGEGGGKTVLLAKSQPASSVVGDHQSEQMQADAGRPDDREALEF